MLKHNKDGHNSIVSNLKALLSFFQNYLKDYGNSKKEIKIEDGPRTRTHGSKKRKQDDMAAKLLNLKDSIEKLENMHKETNKIIVQLD